MNHSTPGLPVHHQLPDSTQTHVHCVEPAGLCGRCTGVAVPLRVANKGPSSQGYGFSSGRVWMLELDCEESGMLKN